MKQATRTVWKSFVLSAVLPLFWAVPAHASTTVARWNMDEVSGFTMFDSSGTGNDGTTTRVTLGLPGYTSADGDFAYSFDGSTSHVKVSDSSSLNPGSSDVTITLHANTSVMPGTGPFDYDLLRKGYNVEIYPKKTGGIAQAKSKFRGNLGRLVLQAGPNLIDGAWHTIACTKTSTEISLTVDGTTFTKSGAIGDIKTNTQPVAVGWQTNSTDFYNGLMDDVSIVIG